MDKARSFVCSAIEASIYISPLEPGLTLDELVEIGRPENLLRGEITDALNSLRVTIRPWGFQIPQELEMNLYDFNRAREPEPRDPHAFEFVRTYLRELGREVGRNGAKVERNVLIAQGETSGIKRHALEVAITCSLLTNILIEKDGLLTLGSRDTYALPSLMVQQSRRYSVSRDEMLARLMARITDVVARRTDGRSSRVEPVDAFEENLELLGHGYFKTWWRLNANELRLGNAETTPTSVSVIAAALCEGALCFIVDRAQKMHLTMHKLPPERKRWQFHELIKAAKSGSDPIIGEDEAKRCMELNLIRQRIHAGRILDEIDTISHPDIRPEEARAAKEITDMLLRRILEWLNRNPSRAE